MPRRGIFCMLTGMQMAWSVAGHHGRCITGQVCQAFAVKNFMEVMVRC